MTTLTAGRHERPTLTLNFEGRRQSRRKRRSPTLSTLELRRLVAEMID